MKVGQSTPRENNLCMHIFISKDINIKFKLFFLLYISYVPSFITEVPDRQLNLYLFSFGSLVYEFLPLVLHY